MVTWLVTFNGVIWILKRNVMPSSEAVFLVIVWELWSEEILLNLILACDEQKLGHSFRYWFGQICFDL